MSLEQNARQVEGSGRKRKQPAPRQRVKIGGTVSRGGPWTVDTDVLDVGDGSLLHLGISIDLGPRQTEEECDLSSDESETGGACSTQPTTAGATQGSFSGCGNTAGTGAFGGETSGAGGSQREKFGGCFSERARGQHSESEPEAEESDASRLEGAQEEIKNLKEMLGKRIKMSDLRDKQYARFTWHEEKALFHAVAYSAGCLAQGGYTFDEIAKEMRKSLFWNSKDMDGVHSKSLFMKYEEHLPQNYVSVKGPNSLKLKWDRVVPKILSEDDYLDKHQIDQFLEQLCLVRLAQSCIRLKEERNIDKSGPPQPSGSSRYDFLDQMMGEGSEGQQEQRQGNGDCSDSEDDDI